MGLLRFSKGEVILIEGHLGDHVFRILDGEVLVCKAGSKGYIAIAKLYAGEIVGEMFLFQPDECRTATVIAASDHVVLEIMSSRDELKRQMANLPNGVRGLISSLSKRLKDTSVHYSVTRKTEQNIPGATLQEKPKIEFSVEDILAEVEASYTKLGLPKRSRLR